MAGDYFARREDWNKAKLYAKKEKKRGVRRGGGREKTLLGYLLMGMVK